MTTETAAKRATQNLQRAIVDGLEDVKAQDIVVYDTEHLSSLFERVIVASGTLDFDGILGRECDGTFEDLFYLLQQEIAKLCDPDIAGKLHTARSRNDIDVTIYRLHLRQDCLNLMRSAMELRRVFLDLASQHHETLIPAYTHTQPAQPSTMAHFLLAMAENVGRDIKRLMRAFENMNYCPLGAGAITTTRFPINRHRVAELLGFTAPTVNSYGSIASVDYFTETLGAVAALLVNAGKFAIPAHGHDGIQCDTSA